MTGKRPLKRGPSKLGPEHEQEVVRKLDEVVLELPPGPAIDDAALRRHARLIARVIRWVEANPSVVVGTRLAMEIVERRWWDRDAVEQCNMQARRKAVRSVEQSLSRRGKGYGYWPAIRAEWEKFSQDPKRFDGVEGFKAAMAAKYGAEPGTLGNKITRWKRERDSHIGES